MKRIVLLSLTCILVVACQDQRSPTGVRPPSALLMDGAHNGGNQHFFFLPPLVPQPTLSGVFNPNLKPVVVICELDVSTTPAACSSAAPINPGPVTVDPALDRPDFGGSLWTHNHYYPSPEMQEDAAEALFTASQKLLSKP